MEAQLSGQLNLVRQALQALYTAPDGGTRKAADTWLQNFRSSAGAWQFCLALLSRPGLLEYEYHFAAQSLRLACCKVPEVLDPNGLQGLAIQLTALLQNSVGAGAWSVAGQLSFSLAALAVRATCWEEEALVPQLLSLLAPQVAAALLADLTLGESMEGSGSSGSGAAVVAAAVSAEANGLYALLQVLANLPEACTSRAVSAHPQRKTMVAAALASDATVVSLLRVAVVGGRQLAVGPLEALGLAHPAAVMTAAMAGGGLQSSALRRAGLQLLHAWAEQLGLPPRGLEHQAELITCLYEALVTSDTSSLAAECICSLLTTCSPLGRDAADEGDQSDTSSSSTGMATGELPAPMAGSTSTSMGMVSGTGSGSTARRSNWSNDQSAGFRKSRPASGPAASFVGGSGSQGFVATGLGLGIGGGAAAARGAAASRMLPPLPMVGLSPERQLAAVLLLQQLLDGLQALLQGAAVVFREQQQQAAFASAGRQPTDIAALAAAAAAAAAAADPGDGAFWSHWSDGAVLQAVCSVLCQAAATVLPAALRGDSLMQARFNALWPQLMALLGHANAEVALSCVSFWQDTYLASLLQSCSQAAAALQGQQQQQAGTQQQQQLLAPPQRTALLQSHLPLLAQLLGGLVSRAALGAEAAAVATADARDLPEEVRMVRRELGATMRDLVGLVGLGHVAAFLQRMVSEHAAQLGAAAEADAAAVSAPASPSAAQARAAGGSHSSAVWTRLESSLYAANVALCGGGAGAGSSASIRTSSSAAASSSDAAANPVVDDSHIAYIVATAAAAVVHPAGSLKLSGTALTLVGGMAAWFSAHPAELARPLEALSAALGSRDEKLARNAATALNRLCTHEGCAALLLGRYAGWVAGLCSLLPGPEVTLRHKPAPGVDLSSRELLVASLMRLACCNPQAAPATQPPAATALPTDQAAQGEREAAREGVSGNVVSRAVSGDAGGGGGGLTIAQQLLQHLLRPRVMAAAAELERLAGALAAVSSSGALQARLQMWRLGARQAQGQQQPGLQTQLPGMQYPQHPQYQQQQQYPQYQQQRYNQQDQYQQQHQHYQQHQQYRGQPLSGSLPGLGVVPAFGTRDGAALLQRAPLCRPGVPHALQQLGSTALVAAQRLGSLASMLLFVPSVGQIQEAGTSGGSVGRRAPDGGGGGGTAATQRLEGDDASAAAAAAATVAPLVVQAVRAVWSNLLACLQPTAAPSQPTPGPAAAAQAGLAGSLLLETQEGSHLLPAACSLLQGALLVAGSGGATTSRQGPDPGAVELLSNAVCLITLSHGTLPVVPTEQQLQQQQWPTNLDWAEPASGRGGGAPHGASRGGRPTVAPQRQQHQQQLRQPRLGPPVCILQLVLGCLPVCTGLLFKAAQPSQQQLLLQQGVLSGPAQDQSQGQGQGQGQQGTMSLQAAVVAEHAVRAASVVVRHACASLQPQQAATWGPTPPGAATASGWQGPDPARILHVLPVFQSLLLHAPQALASSRELLECVVAATVTSMHCHDSEACRSLLEWTQLLLSCSTFAPQLQPAETTASGAAATAGPTASAAPSGLAGNILRMVAAAGVAAGAGLRPGGSGGIASGGRGRGVAGGGGDTLPSGLASLLSRVQSVPQLDRVYAELAVQLDAPCVCCAPSSQGLVFTVAAVESGAAGPEAVQALRQLQSYGRGGGAGGGGGVAAAVGSLGSVLVLGLMVAAAGAMPPDLMLPISTCLHSGWRAMGGARFRAWVRCAAVELSGSGGVSSGGPVAAVLEMPSAAAMVPLVAMPGGGLMAVNMGLGMEVGMGVGMGMGVSAAVVGGPGLLPWARLRPESLFAMLSDLWGAECERDVMRFKRALKALCGGKKKGASGGG